MFPNLEHSNSLKSILQTLNNYQNLLYILSKKQHLQKDTVLTNIEKANT